MGGGGRGILFFICYLGSVINQRLNEMVTFDDGLDKNILWLVTKIAEVFTLQNGRDM